MVRNLFLLQQTPLLQLRLEIRIHLVPSLGPRFEVFAIAENGLDERYAISGTGTRVLGAPRQVFGGVRLSLR